MKTSTKEKEIREYLGKKYAALQSARSGCGVTNSFVDKTFNNWSSLTNEELIERYNDFLPSLGFGHQEYRLNLFYFN